MKPDMKAALIDALECAIAVIETANLRGIIINDRGLSDLKTVLDSAKRDAAGAPSVADAAGASEDDALEKIDREKALRVSGHFDIGINNRMAYRDGWNDCVAAIKKESGND